MAIATGNVLEGVLETLREEEIRLITEIAETLTNIGEESEEDQKRLLDIAQDLREMFFMVAIIGEFNAGKSTFINALLGDKLLPMGITPTTEYIELIRYNDKVNRKPEIRDNSIREWAHPNTGANGVAIVDTPGSGSIFEKHEKVAKSFLHRSDLVIFVISAKRAFAETERKYLELAKDYGKKIILVINQVDLLDASEKSEVRRFIENQAKELLKIEPLIFMVSARDSLATTNSGKLDESAGGMRAIRAHLRGVYNETPPAQQKLLSQLDTTEKMISKYGKKLKGKVDLINNDITKVRNVQDELQQQSLGLEVQMKSASVDIDHILEGIRRRGIDFIDEHLSIRKIGRTTNRDKLQAQFQDAVIGNSLRDITNAASSYINAVVDNSRLYWRGVIDRLNQLQDLMEQELTGLDPNVYAEQRENLQQAIKIAESELKSYSTGQVIRDMEETFRVNMTGFTTSALASVGGLILAVLGLVAPGPLFGAGAAALAGAAFIIGAPVAAGGGILAYRYMRKVSREAKVDFNAKIDELVKNYHTALNHLTTKERDRLTQYGNHILSPIFSRLETLAKRYAEQQELLVQHDTTLKDLRKQIQEQ